MVEKLVVDVVGKRLGVGEQGGDRGVRIGEGREAVGDALAEGGAHGRPFGVDRGGNGVSEWVSSRQRPLREIGAVAAELGDDRGTSAPAARPRCGVSSGRLGARFGGGDAAHHARVLL